MHKVINKKKENLIMKLYEDNWEFIKLCRTNLSYIITRYSLTELLILNYYINKAKKQGLS